MRRWLIGLWVVTIALLAALAVLVVSLGESGSPTTTAERSLGAGGGEGATAPAAPDPHQSWGGWQIVSRLAAHNMLIVTVQTDTMQESVSIAQQLIEQQSRSYAEVMVYFKRPGELDAPPAKRVQWTRENGYVETNLEQYYPEVPAESASP